MHAPGIKRQGESKTLIACEVFRDALRNLGLAGASRQHKIIYLPSHLHLHPEELRRRLLKQIDDGTVGGPICGCLYGRCFADIDEVLASRSIERPACGNCYEMFMGHKAYHDWLREHPGTFFLEKTIVQGFDSLCRLPLELDDPQIRQWLFEHYRQVVYIRQPSDPELKEAVKAIAAFLSLAVNVVDADYSDLALFLRRLTLI